MKDAPRLSIIMPVLNEAVTVENSLKQLAPLHAQGVEVIVVDGGSTDETVLLARPLVDRLLQSGRGRARQMNAGAAVASGQVMLFLHADTLLSEGAISALMRGLEQTHRAWGRFDVCIDGNSPLFGIIGSLMNWRSRLTGIATGDQAIFVRRDDFLAIGGFPDQELMEDIELSRRLKRRSPPLCLREQVVTSGRRWEKHGIWRTIMLMWRLRFLYWLGTPARQLAEKYQ